MIQDAELKNQFNRHYQINSHVCRILDKWLKLQMNIKCGHVDILYIPMGLTENAFTLISGNQLAF